MNDKPSEKVTLQELEEHQVAAYLSRHPDFFRRHPYLLLDLELHGESSGLPNLALQQQRLLREHNTELKKQFAKMVKTAKDNEKVFHVFSTCQRALWQVNSLEKINQVVKHHLLNVPSICACELLEFELRFTAFVANRLGRRGYYLGRLSKEEQALFWPQTDAQSVALYLLGDSEKPTAILALASRDADHFSPENDNLFMNEFLQSLLLRVDELSLK
ncbi:Protein of unknown function DUF484 [Pseudoalteromonas luteoviolacea B = ATCC 29581]|nr:Protein of unknown function DUF484 [Pseudoalteromonas luteoviolacea B = ATCC 29581]